MTVSKSGNANAVSRERNGGIAVGSRGSVEIFRGVMAFSSNFGMNF
jgi:hypothetical protein